MPPSCGERLSDQVIAKGQHFVCIERIQSGPYRDTKSVIVHVTRPVPFYHACGAVVGNIVACQ
jgi:hypothetical protein